MGKITYTAQMGFLRLFLALSVLVTHVHPVLNYKFINSTIAVNSFFILSGFYMSLILNHKYTGENNSYKLYITNRFLRIFPVYWAVLLLMITFALIKLFLLHDPQNAITHFLINAPKSSQAEYLYFISQFVLRNLTLVISPDYLTPINAYPGYLLVQQAWSLQVEIIFYIIAPLLVRRSFKGLLGVFFLYLIFLYKILLPLNLLDDNALLYIITSHFIFFFFGIISYFFLQRDVVNRFNSKVIIYGVIFFLLLITLGEFILNEFFKISLINFQWGVYILLVLVMPFLFRVSNKSQLDKFLGKIAYPVFISHFFIIKLLENIFKNIPDDLLSFMAIIVSLLFSTLIINLLDAPIDRFRQSRLKKQ